MKISASRLSHLEAELRARLEKEPGLEFVLLHGSAARGLDFSDLDLAVSTSQPPARPWQYVADLGNRLEAGLGAPVDVHLVHEAPLEFRYQASKGRPLFVADPPRLANWREKTWSEYFRNQYFFEDYTRHLLRACSRSEIRDLVTPRFPSTASAATLPDSACLQKPPGLH